MLPAVADPPDEAARRRQRPIEVFCLAVWLLFCGWLRAAVPGVNEPHYLAKARHFWNPSWCADDLFLQSANAHWFFYAAVGWLAALFPLPVAAVLGRFAAALVLAWGVNRLSMVLFTSAKARLAVAAIWCGLACLDGYSGEWLIGGVESKIFCYGLLFAGVADALLQKSFTAAVWIGLGTAFHPVIGAWGCLSLLFALTWECIRSRWIEFRQWRIGFSVDSTQVNLEDSLGLICPEHKSLDRGLSDHQELRRQSVEEQFPPDVTGLQATELRIRSVSHSVFRSAGVFVVFFLMAIPGVVPAVGMLLSSPSADVSEKANQIQVVKRLSHHLLPNHFNHFDVGVAVVGALLIAIAGWCLPRDRAWRIWRGMFWGSAIAALAGVIANFTPWRLSLLKFYPFRLSDGLLPLVFAIELVSIAIALRSLLARVSHRTTQVASWVIVAALGGLPAVLPAVDRISPTGSVESRQAWADTCRFARDNTPRDALFLTPRFSFGFRWWAERAEYAVWKDCPQDAGSLVEWDRRLKYIQSWRSRSTQRGYDSMAFEDLAEHTGIDYVVIKHKDTPKSAFKVPPIYENAYYSIYQLKAGGNEVPAAQ